MAVHNPIQDFLYIFIWFYEDCVVACPVSLVMCGHLWNYNWLHYLNLHLCKRILIEIIQEILSRQSA